jgi:hypothetical protein
VTNHIKIVAILFIVFGGVAFVGAAFSSVVFAALVALVNHSQDPAAPVGSTILGITGAALTIMLTLSGGILVACGCGLLKKQNWARILGIVLASISLVKFPLGTVFGVYALWVFFGAPGHVKT